MHSKRGGPKGLNVGGEGLGPVRHMRKEGGGPPRKCAHTFFTEQPFAPPRDFFCKHLGIL